MIMKEEDNNVNNSRKWLEDLSNGTITHDMEGESLAGLHIISARKGFVLCNFVVPTTLSVIILFTHQFFFFSFFILLIFIFPLINLILSISPHEFWWGVSFYFICLIMSRINMEIGTPEQWQR